jgi:hypothetical protein
MKKFILSRIATWELCVKIKPFITIEVMGYSIEMQVRLIFRTA